jgi:hypothetical protein
MCAGQTNLVIKNARGFRLLQTVFIVCPNSKCREFTLEASLYNADTDQVGQWYAAGPVLQTWKLIPPSNAKPFPDYIPPQIIQDYQEACLIADASPKASATLARRCLQGMIRDFWGVAKRDLKTEIEELKGHLDPETWEAIDAIRKIGNIGAHMEKDVNVIIDVEPGEASKLLWLIEVLIREWYIARHQRQEALREITGIPPIKLEAKKTKNNQAK